MTLKIAIIGPESSGKSELTKKLAGHFKAPYIEEYARTYLENLGKKYTPDDLIEIANGQVALEDKALGSRPNLLFCDTNLLVIKIWSEYKYGACDKRILDLMKSRSYDLLLLTKPDIPWKDDPLREHPESREELFEIYRDDVARSSTRYVIISGDWDQRFKKAQKAVAELGIA